jgi:hypothetical protein
MKSVPASSTAYQARFSSALALPGITSEINITGNNKKGIFFSTVLIQAGNFP